MEPGLIFRHTRLYGGGSGGSRVFDPFIHFIDFILTENIYLSANCTISDGIVRKDGDILFKNEAPINDFLISAYQHFQFNYPKFYKMDNLSKLGWLTAELLLENSLNKEDYLAEDVGLILANANSSLDDDLKY